MLVSSTLFDVDFWGSLAFSTLPKCSLCYFGIFWCGCWSLFWADPFFPGTLLLFTSIMFSDSFAVKFTSKNYSAWEVEFFLFVMGKELWGHIDGSDPAPTNVHKLPQWQIKDAWVMTWILG